MDYMKKKLTLKEALDYLEELEGLEDNDTDEVRTVFIEPPGNDGLISGEDDGEDELCGVPDDVCPGQLKANCEILMRSGRRITTLDDENDSDFELDVENASCIPLFADVHEPSSPTSNEPSTSASIEQTRRKRKMKSKTKKPAKRKSTRRIDAIFTWNVDDNSTAMTPIFPEGNYEDCRNFKPHEQFEKFFDDELMQLIADESAKYAVFREKGNPKITVAELRTFIGILLISGYNYHTSLRSMWSNDDDLRNYLVFNSMRKNRFNKILQFLHFEDSNHAGSSENPNPDKMWKLRPITDRLKSKMLLHFHPEPNLSYDESMIGYFGRHGCKQFIKGKPLRFGYKVWSLCTPSGYMVNFEVYQGRNPRSNVDYEEKYGKCAAPLVSMIDELPEATINLPFAFYFDNLFTGLSLLEHLKSRGYSGSGTIRENRIPKSCPLPLKKQMKKQKRGHCKSATINESGVRLTKWVDNSVVCMASTTFGTHPYSNAFRYSKEQKSKVVVPRPCVVTEYNKYMCGVDRLDQNVALYRIAYKGKKWWSSIFTWLVDVSVQNAWQLHRLGQSRMSQLEFRRHIAKYYCQHYGEKPKRSGPSVNPKRKVNENAVETTIRFDGINHLVIPITNKRRCAGDLCKSIGRTACVKCNVGLCVKCFQPYHTKQ